MTVPISRPSATSPGGWAKDLWRSVRAALTAGQAARPEGYQHALQAMALNGALMIAHGGGVAELRVAMLCGLLHDLGVGAGDVDAAVAVGEEDIAAEDNALLGVVKDDVARLVAGQVPDLEGLLAERVGVAIVEKLIGGGRGRRRHIHRK